MPESNEQQGHVPDAVLAERCVGERFVALCLRITSGPCHDVGLPRTGTKTCKRCWLLIPGGYIFRAVTCVLACNNNQPHRRKQGPQEMLGRNVRVDGPTALPGLRSTRPLVTMLTFLVLIQPSFVNSAAAAGTSKPNPNPYPYTLSPNPKPSPHQVSCCASRMLLRACTSAGAAAASSACLRYSLPRSLTSTLTPSPTPCQPYEPSPQAKPKSLTLTHPRAARTRQALTTTCSRPSTTARAS